ncbi:DNA-processing protein DprA [Chitinophaga silvisoli]|uniref:DNA-processing protein DprA n=1 Tax=Chitinophaga silvisoli TaxID=2291814 RepID=A0A3E1P2S1_9BACT|nr:DNA-processing protein DprA [Chitinophaga silvisoli]RFM34467.1 DNA-processing protein DprA [Chitinophaga silvisoli]
MISTEYVIAILQLPKIGRKTAARFLDALTYNINNKEDLYDFLKERTVGTKLPDYSRADIEAAIAEAEGIVSLSEKLGVSIITYKDELYPKQLLEIPDFPIVLSYKGNIQSLSEKPNIAVIGTREPTEYGARIGERIAEVFAGYKFNIVSGLAIGCDTAGHKGALKGKGTTTAVLAHGLDHIYPKENRELADEILQNDGVLLSEYFVKTRALSNFFVERDRIQAGLSQLVVVVETGVKGGTMHTVKYCEEYKRSLVCIAHPDKWLNHEKVQGNQMLIREGRAYGISTPEEIDVLSYLLLDNYFETSFTKEIYIKNFYDALGHYFVSFPELKKKSVEIHTGSNKSSYFYEAYKSICLRIAGEFKLDFGVDYVRPVDSTNRTANSLFKEHISEKVNQVAFTRRRLYSTFAKEIQHDLIQLWDFVQHTNNQNNKVNPSGDDLSKTKGGETDDSQYKLWEE